MGWWDLGKGAESVEQRGGDRKGSGRGLGIGGRGLKEDAQKFG